MLRPPSPRGAASSAAIWASASRLPSPLRRRAGPNWKSRLLVHSAMPVCGHVRRMAALAAGIDLFIPAARISAPEHGPPLRCRQERDVRDGPGAQHRICEVHAVLRQLCGQNPRALRAHRRVQVCVCALRRRCDCARDCGSFLVDGLQKLQGRGGEDVGDRENVHTHSLIQFLTNPAATGSMSVSASIPSSRPRSVADRCSACVCAAGARRRLRLGEKRRCHRQARPVPRRPAGGP